MTADIELLLPEPVAGYGRGCNIELADGQPLYTAEQVRACVSSATEALRAEAAKLQALRKHHRARHKSYKRRHADAIARAERLVEALREAMEWNWLDDDARPSPIADLCDALLREQEVGNE